MTLGNWTRMSLRLINLLVLVLTLAIGITLPANAEDPPTASYSGNIGDNIDLFKGGLSVAQTDLYLPGRAGLDLMLTRFYNSEIFGREDVDSIGGNRYSWGDPVKCGVLGDGWSMGLGRIFWSKKDSAYTTMYGDGSSEQIFQNTSAGRSRFPFRTLSGNRLSAGRDTLYLLNGTRYIYSSYDTLATADSAFAELYSGRFLTKIIDPFGNNIQVSYTSVSGFRFIETIQDALGRILLFQYDQLNNPRNSRLIAIKCLNYKDTSPDTLCIRYAYNNTGQLSTVFNPNGDSTYYAYTNAVSTPAGISHEYSGSCVLSGITTPRGGTVTYVYSLMQEKREFGNFKFKTTNHWAVTRRTIGTDSLRIAYAAPFAGAIDPATAGELRHMTTLAEPSGKSTEYYFTVDTDIRNWLHFDPNADTSFYCSRPASDQISGAAPGKLVYMKVTNQGVGNCGDSYFERHIYYDARSFLPNQVAPYQVFPYLIHDKDCGGFESCTHWAGHQWSDLEQCENDFDSTHAWIDMVTSTLPVKISRSSTNVAIDTILASVCDSTTNMYRVTQRMLAVYVGNDKDSVITTSYYSSDLQRLDSLKTTRGGQSTVVRYEYDSYGNVVKFTDENGYWSLYAYDNTVHAFVTQVSKQKSGSDTLIVSKADYYTRAGLPKWVEGANGDRTEYSYDTFNRPTQTKLPLEGSVSSFRFYDQASGIITDSTKVTSSTFRVTQTKYDGFSRVSYSRMKVGSSYYQDSTTYDYDGNVKWSYRSWDTGNRPGTMKYTEYIYDALGRLASTKVPDQNTSYDSDSTIFVDSRTVEQIDFNGRRSKSFFDYFGNTVTVLANYSGGGYSDTSSALYGPFGKQYRSTPPRGDSLRDSTVYDAFGRVFKHHTPDEGWKEFHYDKAGRVRLTKDALAVWSYFKYDGLGRIIEQGVVASMNHPDTVWSDNSFPTTGTSQKITLKYDSYNDSVNTAYVGGLSYLNNPKGRLTEVYDPTGYSFFFYDKRGRTIKKVTRVTGEDQPRIHTYAYTPGDMLDSLYFPKYSASVRDSIKYDYYDYGWTRGISGFSATGAGTPGFTYEPFGAIKQLQIGDLATKLDIDYSYDDVGRLTSQIITNALASYGNSVFRRSYDYAGVEISKAYRANTAGSRTNIAQSYSYDGAGRLSTAIDSTISGARNYTYNYDKNGNFSSIVTNGTTETYSYFSNTNRLRKTSSQPFYDPIYTYDANGCESHDALKSLSLNYDFRNLTTTILRAKISNGRNATDSLLNYYDYTGRRVKKVVVTWLWDCPVCDDDTTIIEDGLLGGDGSGMSGGGGGGQTDSSWYRTAVAYYYYYSGAEVSLVVRRDANNVVDNWTEQIYAGGKKLGVLERAYSTATKSFLVTDYQGNARNVFGYDGTGDLLLNTAYWYNPFGKQDSVVQFGAGAQILTYNDKELDEELDFGMYYYGARFYDPSIARFSSPDPIRDYHNPYSYVRNNPIRYIDPMGMAPLPSGWGIRIEGFSSDGGMWADAQKDVFSALHWDAKMQEMNARAEEEKRQRKEEEERKNDGPTGGNPSFVGPLLPEDTNQDGAVDPKDLGPIPDSENSDPEWRSAEEVASDSSAPDTWPRDPGAETGGMILKWMGRGFDLLGAVAVRNSPVGATILVIYGVALEIVGSTMEESAGGDPRHGKH